MASPTRVKEAFATTLGRVSRLWRAEIDRRLSGHGSTEAQWLTLLQLRRMNEPATQKMLAAAVGVQEPSMVRMLDRLEADGLIKREPLAGDRRAKAIALTAKATPRLTRVQKFADALREELFDGIEDGDIETCVRVFRKLEARLLGGEDAAAARADASAEGKT
jgi:MarR family transcriptional regulator, transcriptional regulator for hemolysin